jgi:DNA-binding MurR/RpiR family transcriptional regulator
MPIVAAAARVASSAHGYDPPMTSNHALDAMRAHFLELSPQLRKAARFVIDNPDEIALHSMRWIAARAGVHPNVMIRLARTIGFASYAPFRQEFRDWILERGGTGWVGRAQGLRQHGQNTPHTDIVGSYIEQEIENLQKSFGRGSVPRLKEAAALIREARQVYVLGLRSLFSVGFYFHYVCRMFMRKTVLLTGVGGTFADDLRNVDRTDVMIAFSYQPYANDTVKAVKFARERGARIIVVTDSRTSPVVAKGGVNIIVSNTSKSLFPTMLPAFAVAQMLATLLVAESGNETLAEIARSQEQLNRFGVYIE